MTVNLSAYTSVQSAYFVDLDIPDYAILHFSNFDRSYTLSGTSYTNLGQILSISNSQSELRASAHEMTVVISGVPTGSVAEIMDNPIKGSAITIRRAFFTTAGQFLSITGNPATKFTGVVNNVGYNEEWDQAAQLAKFNISLICTGNASLLTNKVAGRRTNPLDEKAWFPDDLGMDRVPTLKNSNFQFGAATTITTAGVK